MDTCARERKLLDFLLSKNTHLEMMTRSCPGISDWWRFAWPSHCAPKGYHVFEVFQSFLALLQLNWNFFHCITSVHCNERKEKEWQCVVLHESGLPNETQHRWCPMQTKNQTIAVIRNDGDTFKFGRTVFSSESKSGGNIFLKLHYLYYLSSCHRNRSK